MRRSIGIVLLLCIASFAYAEEIGVGFVQGIWYAREPVFAEVPNRMYVALRNNSPYDLTGTVRFADNGERIGSSDVHAISGRIIEAWIDWTPTEGSHAITAILTNAVLHPVGTPPQTVSNDQVVASTTLTIQYDTDNDGAGNDADTDDDNDGVPDIDERARGSNPLVQNPKILETKTSETDTRTREPEPPIVSVATDMPGRGLEQYVDNKIVDALLTNVTTKVDAAKQSLDAYRQARTATLATHTPPPPKQDTSTDTVITRSKINTENSILSATIESIASLFRTTWTSVLFALSALLAHPALIQLALLVSILTILFRVVRKIGRRPSYRQ